MTDDQDGTDGETNEDWEPEPINQHRDPERVQAVYDEIANHFSKTRAYPWPEVETFLEDISGVERALDVGCGNGRHTALLAESAGTAIGFDVSGELLGQASRRMEDEGWEGELVQGDGTTLPFQSEAVGVAIYIATLHHLPDRGQRIQSLSELGRVLTASGRALVSAWSTAHDRFDDYDGNESNGFDTTVDWTLPGGETIPRFYHIYAPEEFEEDLQKSGLTVEDLYISSGNCYAEVSK